MAPLVVVKEMRPVEVSVEVKVAPELKVKRPAAETVMEPAETEFAKVMAPEEVVKDKAPVVVVMVPRERA